MTREGRGPASPRPKRRTVAGVAQLRARVMDLVDTGLGVGQIARTAGISRHYAARIMRSCGVPAYRQAIPPEHLATFRAGYESGKSVRQLAREMGKDTRTLHGWRKRLGLAKHKTCAPLRRWRVEWVPEAIAMLNGGSPWWAVAERFGVARQTAVRNVTRAILERKGRA